MHTPGPWTLPTVSVPDHVYDSTGDVRVCELSDRPWMEQAANARLIAQAPTMLDLLTESLMYVEECEEFHKESCRTLSKRIRAAIDAINPTR